MLSEIEKRRYERHILSPEIGLARQEKLKKSKVLIIGLGSTGSIALQYLAAAGIGVIGFCDDAYVDESLFATQFFYNNGDLGKLKTIVAKEKLKILNPFVECKIHNIRFDENNAVQLLKPYELILNCTNKPEIDQIIVKSANSHLVSAMVSASVVTISLFPAHFSKNKNQIDLIKHSGFVTQPSIFGAVAGMAGCMLASEALKILLGLNSICIPKQFTFDAVSQHFESLV